MNPAASLATLNRKDARAELDRIRIEELEEEVRQLRKELVPDIHLPRRWGIHKVQSTVLLSLYSAPDGHRRTSALLLAMEHAGFKPSIDTLKVYISQLRAVLGPHGIEIKTDWGVGYHITPASRSLLTLAIEAARAGA